MIKYVEELKHNKNTGIIQDNINYFEHISKIINYFIVNNVSSLDISNLDMSDNSIKMTVIMMIHLIVIKIKDKLFYV